MTPDVSELKKRLKSNPIYALSLGSRELFHTNFLGWMIETYPQMITEIFDGAVVFDGEVLENIKVEREKLNLDLVLTFGALDSRKTVVIECKVKDTPRPDQLEKYDKKLEIHFEKEGQYHKLYKILLSLVAPNCESQSSENWRYLSFSTLGHNILKLITKMKLNPDHDSIIKHYAQLCCDLDGLVTKAINVDQQARTYFFVKPGNERLCAEVDEALEELRFADTLKKYRGGALRDAIKSRVDSENFSELKPEISSGLDNKTPHVTAKVRHKLPGSSSSLLELVVHIQANQYRRMLAFNRYTVLSQKQGKDEDSIREFIDSTDGWNWMFGNIRKDNYFKSESIQQGFFTGKRKILTNQRFGNLLCSYAPKHIYQHTTINNEMDVTADNVIDAVVSDLHYAVELLSDPLYVARFDNWPHGSQ